MRTPFINDETLNLVINLLTGRKLPYQAVHLYLDVSGQNANADHEPQIVSAIELADLLGLGLKVTQFAETLSFTYSFGSDHLTPAERAIMILNAIAENHEVGTRLDIVHVNIDQNPRELSIISTDFFIDTPENFPTTFRYNTFYTPLGSDDTHPVRLGVIETFLTDMLAKHDLDFQIIIGLDKAATDKLSRQIGEAHLKRMMATTLEDAIEAIEEDEIKVTAGTSNSNTDSFDDIVIEEPSWIKNCERCGNQIRRYRGQSNVSCEQCDAQYNAGGQRLRDDWANNRSNFDEEIGDMEGFEDSFAGDE